MKKSQIISGILISLVVAIQPVIAQQVHRMTLDASTSAILMEANVILIEREKIVTVGMLINNNLPEGTPKIDLKKNDVIMGLNGERIKTMKEFHDLYDGLEPKTEVKLAVKRDDDLFFVTFPKLDPESMPTNKKMIVKTPAGETSVPGERTVSYEKREGVNAGGYTLRETDGKLVVGEILFYVNDLLGDVDIKAGDRILSLNGTPVTTVDTFFKLYTKLESASSVILGIERNGDVRSVSYMMPDSSRFSVHYSKQSND